MKKCIKIVLLFFSLNFCIPSHAFIDEELLIFQQICLDENSGSLMPIVAIPLGMATIVGAIMVIKENFLKKPKNQPQSPSSIIYSAAP